MNLWIKYPIILLGLIWLVSSCQSEKPVKEKKKFSVEPNDIQEEGNSNTFQITAAQFDRLNMELGEARTINLNDAIYAAGYIEVPNESKAEVRSYLGGYLGTSALLPGDFVKKGQFLISLENLDYIQLQQDYLQIKEELSYLKAVYERQKILADEKITSENKRQQAESEYNSALANYEGLRKKLQLINLDPDKIKAKDISSSINLYSPIDGYITSVAAIKGKFADPADVIFEIINTDHLHIMLKVYEKDVLKVKKGQEIVFRVPEANTNTYPGEVFMVGRTIDEADRTVSVHCHITDNKDIPVVVGMYIEAEIYVENHDSFCLNAVSFIRQDNEYYVYELKSFDKETYVFEKMKVNVGRMNESCYEIVGSSREEISGKKILIKGAFDL